MRAMNERENGKGAERTRARGGKDREEVRKRVGEAAKL